MRKKIEKSTTGFGKTLEESIKKKFKNQIDFASALGVTQATVSRYISETASPSFHILQKMSLLLDIELPILRSKDPELKDQSSGVVQVPFFYSEVSAGLGLLSLDQTFDYIKFDPDWLQNQFMIKNCQDIFALKVKGDSMEPTIQEGDIVFAKKFDDNPSSQGIYIVCYNDDYLIKKIQFKNKYLLKLISNNPSYDPIEVNLSDENISFRIIANVFGKINIKSFSHGI